MEDSHDRLNVQHSLFHLGIPAACSSSWTPYRSHDQGKDTIDTLVSKEKSMYLMKAAFNTSEAVPRLKRFVVHQSWDLGVEPTKARTGMCDTTHIPGRNDATSHRQLQGMHRRETCSVREQCLFRDPRFSERQHSHRTLSVRPRGTMSEDHPEPT